jgi:cysteine-S-conjugate beta-lyase
VDHVFYPGLPRHPNHAVAKKQSSGFGGIISFTLKEDSLAAARSFVCSTELFKLAESLGGIKSLISHSAEMTHKTIPPDIRRAAGVQDSLIRLSVGLEDAEDLITDLRNTFDRTVVRSNTYSLHLENC